MNWSAFFTIIGGTVGIIAVAALAVWLIEAIAKRLGHGLAFVIVFGVAILSGATFAGLTAP